jgi:hypothetical protein
MAAFEQYYKYNFKKNVENLVKSLIFTHLSSRSLSQSGQPQHLNLVILSTQLTFNVMKYTRLSTSQLFKMPFLSFQTQVCIIAHTDLKILSINNSAVKRTLFCSSLQTKKIPALNKPGFLVLVKKISRLTDL